MGSPESNVLKIRRALFTVSDKSGIVELAQALSKAGAEIVATGKTATVLRESGLKVTPIEEVSGSPEAFQGRMKTLSFPVCSGILSRRGDAGDEKDLERLKISAIDCVVVNFYPFVAAAAKPGLSRKELIEEVDIGGPTLVRAAAKNAPDVLVLTSPTQYGAVLADLSRSGTVRHETSHACAAEAWDCILQYDAAIAERLGTGAKRLALRYGENPHQTGALEVAADSPIAWPRTPEENLTATELSYNNILDLSAAYALASDLAGIDPDSTGVVIVKHNNPCGVALVPKKTADAQKQALIRAWEGDPVSAFGGVLVFTAPIEDATAEWLAPKFVELVSAPGLTRESRALTILQTKRKNLKAVGIRSLGGMPLETAVQVPGGRLIQSADTVAPVSEELRSVTRAVFSQRKERLARFGIAVTRALKSNAIALVREIEGVLQLVGAGQGQPNRIDSLKSLAVPRALAVLQATGGTAKDLGECILVSDAFFPFRDTVDTAHEFGIRWIIQPGGSIKDAESIAACDAHGISMAFTGRRHFKH